MKKQSGFTLIELLLVLAIIGIIAAIALPAMLGQRARAKDKTAVQGSIGRLTDLVGQYDKAQEAIKNGDTASVKTILEKYITLSLSSKDKNPWGATTTDLIFNTTIDTSVNAASKTSFDAALLTKGATQTIGQGVCYLQMPTAATPGFIGVAVKLNQQDSTGKNLVNERSTAVE
ncbi:MAG TPA: prepilin-type N-terminal cleavage/methylation domain-containing protein [Holophagaceae bacterium]|nr:prepilin-type N-terminal cleavage/methylation domain-containing protein [Holophagaceae bacterium]